MSRSHRGGRRRRNSNSYSKTGIIVLACVLGFLFVQNFSSNDSASSTELTSDGYDAVCFVTGNVANSPEPDFSNAESIISDVFDATEAGETPNVCMYSATANPYSIEIDDKYLSAKGQNEAATTSQLKKLIRGVNEAAQTSPSESGANYYEAILQAADYLESYDAKNPVIIVYGSGLSDTGSVNFAFDNLLSQSDGYITNKLSVTNIHKDAYTNIDLKWLGAGQAIANDSQSALSETWKNKVQDVYSEALAYVGIEPEFKSVQVSDSTESVATDFYVNPTQIPEELKPGYTLSLNESIAKFKPDSAELYNYDEVKDALTEFAKSFNSTSNIRVKITGYQTYCATSKTLSENRATTIRDILVNELSVSPSRIDIDGVAGPQDDRTENPRCGTTGVAAEHRTVIMEVVEE